MQKFEGTVRLPDNTTIRVPVTATSYGQAKTILEQQYGRGNVLNSLSDLGRA